MTDLFDQTPVQTLPPIKVLSLWQPWASLIAAGVKLHETRHWAARYRGPLAIHAARKFDWASAPDDLCHAALGAQWMTEMPRGVVLGIGTLADCRLAETVAGHLTPADLAAGNFARGRFAWRIEGFRRLAEPIPLTGRQGLFNWSPPFDLETRLGPPLDHGAATRLIGWAA